jgi:hypothetical protein
MASTHRFEPQSRPESTIGATHANAGWRIPRKAALPLDERIDMLLREKSPQK